MATRTEIKTAAREGSAVPPGGGLEGMQRGGLAARAEQIGQIGSWELRPATRELVWSDNLFRLCGLEPGEVSPTLEVFFGLIHPDDRAGVERQVGRLRTERRLERLKGEFRIVLPDGGVRHLRTTVAFLEGNGAGFPNLLMGSVQDRTEELRAKRAIAAHYAVSEALESWASFPEGACRLIEKLADALGCDAGAFWASAEDGLTVRTCWTQPLAPWREFEDATRTLHLPRGEGLVGRAWEARAPAQYGHRDDLDEARRRLVDEAGLKGGLAIPTCHESEVLAVLEFYSREGLELTDDLARALMGIAYELGAFLAHHRGELSPPQLTPRQLEVLQLAGHGHSRREIAELLVISPATVKTHFENIYTTLKVSDRAEAVAEVLRLGLIE